MQGLIDTLILYRVWVLAVISTIVLILLVIKFWDKIKFWWLCSWMSFPLIGGIAKLSKSKTIKDKWYDSERVLCSKFYRYYISFDKDGKMYDNSVSYLNKIDEIGRKPLPIFMLIVIFALVILEALGFAYVLAGYTIPGASESLQQKGALGIAFIISIILVMLTHFSGDEMYKNSLAKKVREFFVVEKNDYKNNTDSSLKLIPNSKVNLQENHLDDNEPRCLQILNRLKHTNAQVTRTWYITIVTVTLITLIAIGATYVRGQVLEKQLNQEISNVVTNVYESVPSELAEIQTEADNKALQEQQEADRKGGWATFIVLAVLFVFIQILGIIIGFKWGFAGKQSKEAYLYSHGFASRDEFESFYNLKKDRIASIANEKLSILQSKMSNLIHSHAISGDELDMVDEKYRTFDNYIKEHKEKDRQRRIDKEVGKVKEAMEIKKGKEKVEQDSKNDEIYEKSEKVEKISAPKQNEISSENSPSLPAQKSKKEILKEFKELLDDGLISQEKYDEKVKEILG